MNRQLTFLLWDDDSFNWRWSVGCFDLYRQRSRCKNGDMCLLIRLLPLISLGKISHVQDYAVFNAAQTVRDCSLD